MSNLINFLNAHPHNWESLLSNEPYYFLIKHDGPYTMFKYTFGVSDFSYPICREARGLIARQDTDGAWICVARGLDKFFNAMEPQADSIDWQHQLWVTEKMDGSNIRLWYDNDEWHLSTLGLIDATDTIHGKEFLRAVGGWTAIKQDLLPGATYVFEMLSPLTRIVCRVPQPIVYFISRRVNEEESGFYAFLHMKVEPLPQLRITSLNDALNYVAGLPENHEGIVVRDQHNHRIKIKSPWYLALHVLRGNGVCTIKRALKLWQEEKLDDFIGEFPEYKPFIDPILDCLRQLIIAAQIAYTNLSEYAADPKMFAQQTCTYNKMIQNYLFARRKEPGLTAYDYYRTVFIKPLIQYVSVHVELQEYGEEEEN